MGRQRRHLPGPMVRHGLYRCRCHYRGQWVYLGPWDRERDGPSEEATAEYRRLVDAAIADPVGAYVRKPSRIMAEVMEAYTLHRKASGAKPHQIALARVVGIRVAEYCGDLPVSEFGPKALTEFCQSLGAMGRQTIRYYVRTILSAIAHGISEEHFSAADTRLADLREAKPLTKCIAAKPEKRILPASYTDIERVISHCVPTVADMIRTHRATGMRSTELCMMRWDRIFTRGLVTSTTGIVIDLDAATERARAAKIISPKETVWLYVPVTHKKAHLGQPRDVPLLPAVQTILERYRTDDPSSFVFSPRRAFAEFVTEKRAKRKSKVQPSQVQRAQRPSRLRHRDHYDHGSYRRSVEYACDRAGIPPIHPHQIRHAVGTTVYGSTGDPTITAALLGHADLRTVQRYARRSVDAAIAGAAAIS